MPELPEVETMRRGIAAIVGGVIADVKTPRSAYRPIEIAPPLGEFRRRVRSKLIISLGRVGKRLVIELDSHDRIVIEPRMTGRILLAEPPNTSHLRLVFELTGVTAPTLLFWDSRGLGVVRLLTPEEFAEHLGPDRLGPDALVISDSELKERLRSSSRPIKVALMDQRVLTGIGNLYASEILHRARLSPELPCNCLRTRDWTELHGRIQEVLQEAISLEGSTLSDGMYRTAANEEGGFQNLHRVYQRAGKPCGQCGRGSIVRIVQAQRSTFFCPSCQRSRPTSRRSSHS